jgi:predicted DCC family thiol-disulfide oxidoreductase YuxK
MRGISFTRKPKRAQIDRSFALPYGRPRDPRHCGIEDNVAQQPTVLFDGICNLCNATVRTIEAASRGRFRFASLDSHIARELAETYGRSLHGLATIVLVDASGWHERSDAALRIACELPFPWPLLGVFFALPVRVRDRAYDWVARNRYRWFGTR